MSYAEHMNAGNCAVAERRYDEAFEQFSQAHALGRDIRIQHIAAHRAMMRTGWAGRRVGRYLTQLGLWAGAHLTSDHLTSELAADR
jgi:hypothetical protein